MRQTRHNTIGMTPSMLIADFGQLGRSLSGPALDALLVNGRFHSVLLARLRFEFDSERHKVKRVVPVWHIGGPFELTGDTYTWENKISSQLKTGQRC